MALDSRDYDMVNNRLSEIRNKLSEISIQLEESTFVISIIMDAMFGGDTSVQNLYESSHDNTADIAQNLAQFVHDFNCSMYEISERYFSQMVADDMGGDSDE